MSEHDLMQIRRVGDRLRSAFRQLVEGLPPSARNISGMARWLGVHKATCQRIVEGLDPGRDGLSTFSRLPGVDGLRMLVTACAGRGVRPDLIAAAAAAVDEYAQLLETHGRTQRGLVRVIESLRIEAAGPAGKPDREMAEDQRKALFDGARRVTGEEMRGKATVAIVRPNPGDPSRLEAFLYSRLVGVRRYSFSRPVVMSILSGWWAHLHDSSGVESAEARPAGVAPEEPPFSLIEDFSTTGVRPVNIGSADARTLVVVDLENVPSDGEGQGPVDVTGRFHSATMPNPVWDSTSRLNVATRIARPTRAMLMDVYVHADLGTLSPQLACYSVCAPPGDARDGGPDHCWFERFPESAEIRTLGRGGADAPAFGRVGSAFARHEELVRFAFARDGLDASQFTGYRTEVAYPIWQSEYRMYLEAPREENAN